MYIFITFIIEHIYLFVHDKNSFFSNFMSSENFLVCNPKFTVFFSHEVYYEKNHDHREYHTYKIFRCTYDKQHFSTTFYGQAE